MKPRPKKRKKYLDPGTVILLRQVFWGVLVFVTIAILITAIWYGTRVPALSITTITVSGGQTIDKELVKAQVNQVLEGAYLKIVPKRFTYFYPEAEVLKRVYAIERIKEVKIEKVSSSELKVTFSEFIPDNLWCNSKVDTQCYFLDETGYAFGTAPVLSGESLVRYYSIENELNLNTRPFSEADYLKSKDFIKRLAEIGWFVSKVEINSARDAFYTLGKGGEVKVTLTENTRLPFENLLTVLNSEEFDHLEPGNFKYLDLRFGTRVFVNEELEIKLSTSTSATTTLETRSVIAEP